MLRCALVEVKERSVWKWRREGKERRRENNRKRKKDEIKCELIKTGKKQDKGGMKTN